MIQITVRTVLFFSDILGSDRTEISIAENSSIEDLIDLLINRFGDRLKSLLIEKDNTGYNSHNIFLLNGRYIRVPEDFTKKLEQGDIVTILPPVFGG